jgi:hypothetical protein
MNKSLTLGAKPSLLEGYLQLMNNMNYFKRSIPPISWVIYTLCGLVCAFFISWILLAKVGFAYAWLHDALDIQQHSQLYGPQNRYRHSFQYTDKTEHIRLFSDINTAIHNQGEGLADIKYHRPNGEVIDQLLHRAEIIHLQDVANLLDVLKYLGGGATIIWLILAAIYRFNLLPKPNAKQQTKSIIALIGLMTLLVFIIGPVRVFYTFHEWIFPHNHQWFFFYQESLMTILMKAPDLFGFIAILLTSLALILFLCLNLGVHALNTKFQSLK